MLMMDPHIARCQNRRLWRIAVDARESPDSAAVEVVPVLLDMLGRTPDALLVVAGDGGSEVEVLPGPSGDARLHHEAVCQRLHNETAR